jgi:hypothetical protein
MLYARKEEIAALPLVARNYPKGIARKQGTLVPKQLAIYPVKELDLILTPMHF